LRFSAAFVGFGISLIQWGGFSSWTFISVPQRRCLCTGNYRLPAGIRSSATVPDVGVVAAWLGILVTVGGAVAGAVKFGFWVFDEWQKRKAHEGLHIPEKTLQMAPMPEGHCWWAMGKRGDDPTMQIVGRMFVTNISAIEVRLPHAELRYSLFGRKKVSGLPSVSRGPDDNLHGMFDIPPGETRTMSFDFWVFPPVVEPKQAFTAHSVRFMDQFGNKHTVRRVRFESLEARKRPTPKEPDEWAYEIADPIAKEIVAVLRAELARYAVCGRSVGGLGSVHIVHNGRAMTGVGGDSWTADSPLNQVLAADASRASLQSDNLDALIAFHTRLGSDNEKQQFAAALLERLDENKGYLGVSYFIVAALSRIGLLNEALQKARKSLPSGEQRVFGLSNVLMLLNGLLKYRHTDFSPSDLDNIERFIHGLDEHPFRIPEKLAAVRAARLSAGPQG
jgi:hypothetical protein